MGMGLMNFEIEYHVKWLEELLLQVENKNAKSVADYLKELCDRSRRKEVQDQPTDANGGSNSDNGKAVEAADNGFRGGGLKTSLGKIAFHLNDSAMLVRLGDWESALVALQDAAAQFDDLKGEAFILESHEKAFDYAMDSLNWKILVTKTDAGGGSDAEFVSRKRGLFLRWKSIINDKGCMAAVAFMKGCLAAALMVPDEKVLVYFKEAADLQPEYYLWFHYCYRKSRRIRRVIRSGRGYCSDPSTEEMEMCHRAYELGQQYPSEACLTMYDYALLQKERLWMKPAEYWKEHIEIAQECNRLLRDALRLATENGYDHWARPIKMHLAEFLAMGKCELYDPTEGMLLFDECLDEFPDSTELLHKLGKLHLRGTFLNNLYKDVDLARECFRRALSFNPCNFPCLMDYLKVMGNKFDMIKAIDKVLPEMILDVKVANLHIMRGLLLWNMEGNGMEDNKRLACKSWLLVVQQFPNLMDDLRLSIANPLRSRVPHSIPRVSVDDVVSQLTEMITDDQSEEELQAINVLIEQLQLEKQRNDKRPPTWSRGRDPLTDMKNLRLTESSSERSFKPSVAGKNDNWRGK